MAHLGRGIGFLIALTGIIPNYLQENRLLPTEFSFPLLNVLVIAPLFEEFLLRGAIQGNLEKGYSFWNANLISSVFFVILHIPGWYFMGVLVDNLTNPFGGALSIFLVSLAFGYADPPLALGNGRGFSSFLKQPVLGRRSER